jgi:hypothetical protein
MHTSAGAAYGRDDDGAPELFVRHSFRTMKIKETRLYVNDSIRLERIAAIHRGFLHFSLQPP